MIHGRLPNPWRRLADARPDVTVEWRDLGIYLRGFTHWPPGQPPVIVQNSRLNQTERRCNITHEFEHLVLGAPCGEMSAWDEHQVRIATARFLLPDLSMVSRLMHAYDIHHAAAELWVTPKVLVDRLRNLTDAESDSLIQCQDQQQSA